jgi:hypothetical protein
MKRTYGRPVAAILILILVLAAGGPAILPVQAQPDYPLDGSFSGALALRRLSPDDPTGDTGQIILAVPGADGVSARPITAAEAGTHIIDWLPDDGLQAGGLLHVRSEGETVHGLRYDLAADTETLVTDALPLGQTYALLGDGTQVIGWPMAGPVDAITLYNAIDLGWLDTWDMPSDGLADVQFAGLGSGGSNAYFYTPNAQIIQRDISRRAVQRSERGFPGKHRRGKPGVGGDCARRAAGAGRANHPQRTPRDLQPAPRH